MSSRNGAGDETAFEKGGLPVYDKVAYQLAGEAGLGDVEPTCQNQIRTPCFLLLDVLVSTNNCTGGHHAPELSETTLEAAIRLSSFAKPSSFFIWQLTPLIVMSLGLPEARSSDLDICGDFYAQVPLFRS